MKLQDVYDKKEAMENNDELNQVRQLRDLANENYQKVYYRLDAEVQKMTEEYLDEVVAWLIKLLEEYSDPLLQPNLTRITYGSSRLREIFLGYNKSQKETDRAKQLEKVSIHARNYSSPDKLLTVAYMVRSGDYKQTFEGELNFNDTPPEAAGFLLDEVVRMARQL